MSASRITALIVDDEHHARDRLRVLLSGEPDIEIVGACENGLDALAAISRMRPELVFLDVQMPDLDGLGVIAALGEDETPEIIFVTAHDAYMERAFEVHAVDYLRKPYTNARFASALTRARWLVRARRSHHVGDGGASAEVFPNRSRYSPMLATVQAYRFDSRIALRDLTTGVWHLVDQYDIYWIEGDGSARVARHERGEGTGPKRDAPRVEAWAREQLKSFPDIDLVLVGHSHMPVWLEVEPGRFYLNTGDWIEHMTYAVLPTTKRAPELRRWPDHELLMLSRSENPAQVLADARHA